MAFEPKIDLTMKNEITRLKQNEAENKYKQELKDFREAQQLSDYAFEQKQNHYYRDLVNKGKVPLDEKGNRMGSKWDKLRLAMGGQSQQDYVSYNTFNSSMMALLIAYKEYLLEAVMQERDESVMKWILLPAHKGLRALFNKFTLTDPSKPEVVLPLLVHNVDMNEDNELKIAPLVSEDGSSSGLDEENKEFNDSIQDCFTKGVEAWLKEGHGYTRIDGTQKFKNADGTELTKEEFEKLKNHEENGLDAYLSGKFDLSFKPGPKP